jgi:F-type H+-transporting ATPase subunit delta
MKERVLSMRYAQALFDLASAKEAELKVEDDLKAFLEIVKARKEAALFQNPVLSSGEKKEVLVRLGAQHAMEPLTMRFLELLIRKSRFALLSSIVECFHELLNASHHFEEVEIVTARPLPERLKQSLVGVLEKKLGEKVVAQASVNPRLLGGASVRIRHKLFDGSLSSKLETLRQLMTGALA